MTTPTPLDLDAAATAAALPYPQLAQAIAALLRERAVDVPSRVVLPLTGGGHLFVMPAADGRLALTKLITLKPDNAARGLPAIQGDIVVFEVATGRRVAVLDGPTVTARRTAAVSLLAAQRLAPRRDGPLLVVGAGVQGRAHIEAFQAGLGVREVWIASRSPASREALAAHARTLGLRAQGVDDADAALSTCPLVATCTPALEVTMCAAPRDDAFITAVGAYRPDMAEWASPVCQAIAARGTLVVDTRDADHEAGDLLQAGVDVSTAPTLADVLSGPATPRRGAVFFKSCGWAGWDLAAARCVLGG